MALITFTTKVQFDFGAITLLPEELNLVGISRPLIVTDKGIVDSGLINRLREVLEDKFSLAMFDRTPGNPTEEAILDAVDVYRKNECDGILAFGGGSPIDLAKIVSLLASHPLPLRQYCVIYGGVEKIKPPLPPVVAVPTTAGTGSEVGRGSVISFSDGRKLNVMSPLFFPKVAICDPELTLDLPPQLTASTGVDALTHCIEAYLSPAVNPPAESIALDGIRRARGCIERAFLNGKDREARWHMLMASVEGGLAAFQMGLGAVHALSHALGGLTQYDLHHGTLNAVFLPPVLRYNADHVGDKYVYLGAALGLPPSTDVSGAIDTLNAALGLPRDLRAMGVTEDVLPQVVEAAVSDPATRGNPRPVSAEDYERLFLDSLG